MAAHTLELTIEAFEGVPIEIDIDDSWPNTLCARKASNAEWGAKVEQARIIFGRFADAICECEEVRRHIITSEIDGDMHDLVFLAKMRPGWLEKAKDLLPAEYEGIRVKFMELGSHYTKALSWCTRNLRAWMQDGNPRFEKIKKIHERFSAYLHAGLKPLEQLVSLETKADEQGEPYFVVAINDKRWEVVKEKNLPHEVEGIPVKYVPSASQPSTDYPQTPCSWMRDDNPRFQEFQKIKVRFSAHVRTHLEPVKESISMGTGCDDQGEPYFEVGINHGSDDGERLHFNYY